MTFGFVIHDSQMKDSGTLRRGDVGFLIEMEFAESPHTGTDSLTMSIFNFHVEPCSLGFIRIHAPVPCTYKYFVQVCLQVLS